MNWSLNLATLNAVWVRLFPRMMGKVWKHKKLSLDVYNNPALFEEVYGKTIDAYLNYTKSVYDFLGVPNPQFMTDIRCHPHFAGIEIDQLKELAAQVKEVCALPLEGHCAILFAEIGKLEQLIDAFDAFEPEVAPLGTLSSELLAYWISNKASIQGVLGITDAGYGVQKKRLENLKAFMEAGGVYAAAIAAAGDDKLLPVGLTATFRHNLCYEYIISSDQIIFPWPERPVNEAQVYNMYVVRETGKPPMVLPGLNTGILSTPGPGNESGISEGFADPGRCLNVQAHLNDLAPKWGIKGSQLQLLANGIPRAIAEIWGNDLLYDRYILVVREEILIGEAKIIDHLFELAQSSGHDADAGETYVSWQEDRATREQEIASIENGLAASLSKVSGLIRNAQNYFESAHNDAEATAEDKATITDCVFRTSKIRTKNLYESRMDARRVLAEINRTQTEHPLSGPTVIKKVSQAKKELDKVITEVVPNSSFVPFERKQEVRTKIAAMLQNFIEEQIEFVFPHKVRIEFVKSTPSVSSLFIVNDSMSGDGEGVVQVPFPERPNLDELFRSWSSGDSHVPTFTASGS
ncbi:MAG: hypothetical protein AAF564_16585 [Bacteroidota bacterium]